MMDTQKLLCLLLWLLFTVNLALDAYATSLGNGGRKLLVHNGHVIQNHGAMLKPRSKSVDDISNTNQLNYDQETKVNSDNSNFKVSHREPTSQKFDSQKISPTTNKFMTLMHKDYNGFRQPHRKPPINNHEPLDADYTPIRKPPTSDNNYESLNDYTPPRKPRRKPPINNHQPLDEDNGKP